MNLKSTGITIDPEAVLKRLPALRAALKDGKTATDHELHNVPESAKSGPRERLARIEQGFKELDELEAYVARMSAKQ
jgi:hypothetical protein